LKSLPSKPGVYIFKNAKNKIIYIGKAKDIKKRASSYFVNKNRLDAKTIKLVENIVSLEYIIVDSEFEAFFLEANLIKKNRPFYNIKMSDDKNFPYIAISKKDTPYISIVRKKDKKNIDYFGPYLETTSLKSVLRVLRRIFPFQSVKNHPKRKCLYFYLGLCPCIPALPDNYEHYILNVKRLKSFLRGNTTGVINSLKKEQKIKIKEEEFEKAAEIQKQIERINFITQKHYSPFHYENTPNFHSQMIEGEVKSLSDILKKYGLDIKSLKRIECYDISNIQGKLATGSMVVFINGEQSKKDYRKFKILTKDTPDDYVMHQEMMHRRLKHPEWGMPELIVIDGGKGQVSSVQKILRINQFDIPLIGLAKREEIIVIPVHKFKNQYDFIEVKLPKSTPGINLLRRIRDEAHRFAIEYHRLLRKKKMLEIN